MRQARVESCPKLIAAAEKGETMIITRHGRPVAALVPIAEYVAAPRQLSLLPLAGTGRGLWGRDSRRTLRKLRDELDRELSPTRRTAR